MTAFDPARWAALSPRLDELLELDAPGQADRLAQIRAADPAEADALEALLGHLPGLEQESFLQQGAVRPPAAGAGRAIGPYVLERELGRGGMGEVWLARRADGRYEGRVAIKFLQSGLFSSGDSARFAREGSILARLSHPHIARLLDAGVTDDALLQPYLVLEYVDGVAIDTWCSARGLGPRECLQLLLDVMDAVAHAHTRLILHRDLKPSNILVDEGGRVKLLDFGIAKLLDDSAAGASASVTELTQRAGAAFTPLYAAPEQVQGGDVTTATDVYALGVLMYRLLAGTHPIDGAKTGGTLERLRAIVESEPRRLSEAVLRTGGPGAARRARELHGDLDTIVAKAMKKAPGERYANAAALAEDVRRALQHEPIAARPDSTAYRLAKFVRRHRAGVAAGSVAAVAVVAGVTVALAQAHEAHLQRQQAEGLVEYMLGDLRKQLQPVGRLDVLDGVGARALAYYAAQDATQLDADSLGRRARALHLIGEIADKRGHLEEAQRMFREAARSTGELLARHPRDGQRVYDHAQSEYWMGYIGRRLGRLADEEAGFQAYLDLAQRMVAINPANGDWRLERGYATENMGLVRLDAGRFAEALDWYTKAQALFEAERPAHPELAMELANLLGWRARAEEGLGRYREAMASNLAKLPLLAQAPGADKDRNAQYLRSVALHEAGRMAFNLDEPAVGEPYAREALAVARALVADEPSRVDWQEFQAVATLGLADLLYAEGHDAQAREAVAQAAPEVHRLVATNGRKPIYGVALHGRLLVLQALLDRGDDPALTARLRDYAGSLGAYRRDGQSLDVEAARDAAGALLALGDRLAPPPSPARATALAQAPAHARAPSHASASAPVAAIALDPATGAREAWESVLALTARDAAAGDAYATALRAQAFLRLGDLADARALDARVRATALRAPVVQDLQRRLDAADGAQAALASVR